MEKPRHKNHFYVITYVLDKALLVYTNITKSIWSYAMTSTYISNFCSDIISISYIPAFKVRMPIVLYI